MTQDSNFSDKDFLDEIYSQVQKIDPRDCARSVPSGGGVERGRAGATPVRASGGGKVAPPTRLHVHFVPLRGAPHPRDRWGKKNFFRAG